MEDNFVEINRTESKNLKDSKLVKLLTSLGRKELNAFKKFLNSPFFNQRQDVIQLFEIIEKRLRSSKKFPDRVTLFHQIYPNQPFNDSTFRLVKSYLYKLIEHFLAYQEVFENELETKLHLANNYLKRDLPDLFQRTLKQLEINLEKHPLRNVHYYNTLSELQMKQFQFEAAQKQSYQVQLQEFSDTIDITYLTQKLRQTCLITSHQSIYKSEYQIGFLNEVIQFVEAQGYLEIPAIDIYYQCYFMLIEPETEAHFFRFKNLIIQHNSKFPTSEIRDLHLLALNYCIRQVNSGNVAYFQEILDLYKTGLQNEYLLKNGTLSNYSYHNIVSAGLRTEDYEWVEFFIKNYLNNLEKKYRDSSLSFNMARLEYCRKNYDSALELLQKSNYRDLLVNLLAKTVLLKIYYELSEFDLLHSHLDAMKNYVRRKQVIGYHKTNSLNIIKYAHQLIKLNPFDKKEQEILRQNIQKEEVLTEREWLLEQVK